MPVATCAYSAQLELKRDIVIQSIEKHTKIDPTKLKIRPTIGMEDPWRYRNKSQFQTRMVGSGQVETGFSVPILTNLFQLKIVSSNNPLPSK